MGKMPAQPNPDKDEPVKLPLDPEEALRALLQVRPENEQVSTKDTKEPA